jgi:hypothetical protein
MSLFSTKRKVAAACIAGAVLLGTGIAGYAYWTSSGNGVGTASTGTSSTETLTQTTVLNPLAPGVAAQAIHGTVTNTNGSTEHIGTVTPTVSVVTETSAELGLYGPDGTTPGTSGLAYLCSLSDYTVAPNAVNLDEVSGATNVTFGTIAFNDLGVNQNACQGASVSLTFASN